MEYILSGLETINGLLTSVLNFAVFDWELLISVIFWECKIVCVNRYCMNLLYAPYWGKQR